MSDQVKVWEANFVSRFIGFLIRLIIIFISLIAIGLTAVVFALGLGVWLLTPFLIIVLPVVALTIGTGR